MHIKVEIMTDYKPPSGKHSLEELVLLEVQHLETLMNALEKKKQEYSLTLKIFNDLIGKSIPDRVLDPIDIPKSYSDPVIPKQPHKLNSGYTSTILGD